jgi:tripartite-type tricarboxylate transporter receptor subunit TctC
MVARAARSIAQLLVDEGPEDAHHRRLGATGERHVGEARGHRDGRLQRQLDQPAEQDLLAGEVDIFLAPYGRKYDDFARQGKLKILAMLNRERLDSVRAYPAITESKALRDFTFSIWTGYFVKKDTPEAVVQRLHKAITDTLSDPQVRSALEAQSQLLATPLPLEAVGKAYADGTAQFRAIARAINLQPQ